MTTGTAETVPAAARSTRTDGSTEKATRTRRTRTNAGEGRQRLCALFPCRGQMPRLRRTSTRPKLAKELFFRRNQASAALNAYDKRAGEELKALVNGLQKWSSSKNRQRLSYLSALHSICLQGAAGSSGPEFGGRNWVGSCSIASRKRSSIRSRSAPVAGRSP